MPRDATAVPVLAAVALGVVIVLAIVANGFRHGLDDTASPSCPRSNSSVTDSPVYDSYENEGRCLLMMSDQRSRHRTRVHTTLAIDALLAWTR